MQCLTIFDWDDTLFPTTYYTIHGIDQSIRDMESSVCNLLTQFINTNQTCIVTNAQAGWIEYVLDIAGWTHMAQIVRSITVISARSRFESLYPTEMWQWKRMAFSELVNQHQPTQCVVIGDNEAEHDALRFVNSTLRPQMICKSVRLSTFPCPQMMREQSIFLTLNRATVLTYPTGFDVRIICPLINTYPQEPVSPLTPQDLEEETKRVINIAA